MMKHTQTIVTKGCERAFSAVASSVKESWKDLDGLALGLVFVAGYTVNIGQKYYKRCQHSNKVSRMQDELIQRMREYNAKLERNRINRRNMLRQQPSSLEDGERRP